MGIENGGDSPARQNREAEIAHRLAIWKLETDARNVFARLDFAVFKGKRGEQFSVKSLPHYKDYLTQRAGTPQEEVDFIMSLSDPQAVAAFDQVVDEFNTEVDRINREQDFEAVHHLETRGFDVLKQKR
jgi:hypothetical protein